MKQTLMIAIPFLALAGISSAATIAQTDPHATGTGYHWQIVMGANESVSTVGQGYADVGIWSWQTNKTGEGWTHTSDWARLVVTEAVTLEIVMGRNASIPNPAPGAEGTFLPVNQLFPSFSIWAGTYDYATEFAVNHVYENTSLISWTSGLTELMGYVDNSTEDEARLVVQLEAGDYTLALGGNGPMQSGRTQGYYASFTTIPIPEPSSALLGLAGGLLVLRRRR